MTAEPTFTCATCDVAIAHHPTFHLGLAFCCAGCAADGPCGCSYDLDATQPVAAFVPARTAVIPSASVAAPAARPAPAGMPVPADMPAPATALPRRVPAPAGSAAPSMAAARR